MIDRTEAQRMRLEGATYQEIGIKMGVSRQRIHQALIRYKSSSQEVIVNRYRKNLKKRVLSYYGGGKLACIKCGFSDIRALSIDHINGNGCKHRKKLLTSGKTFYRWLEKQDYPKGYQTLCMNCQFIKREENRECCQPGECSRLLTKEGEV